jgi:AsmA-like protein
MDSNTTYTKTARGLRALVKKLPRDAGHVLSVIDKSLTADEIRAKVEDITEKDFEFAITWLLEGGFIKSIVTDPFPNSMWDVSTKSAMQVDEIGLDEFTVSEKLPATDALKAPVVKKTETEIKAEAEEKAKLEAKKKALEQADAEARARAEAALKAKNEAESQAIANKEKISLEEKARAEAEEKAKQEALAKAEKEAQERAEAEAKAKAEAEAFAKKEAEARKKAEEKAAAEEKARREAEEKAKQEARERAEAEAKAKAEAEAFAKKEAEARKKAEEKAAAEEKARREAEEKAKQEARERAEAEAKAKAEAEAFAKKEAEARKKAEEKAAAEEKARVEKEEKAAAKEKARLEKEEKAKAKAEAAEKAKLEAEEKAQQKALDKAEARAVAQIEAEKQALEKAAVKEQARLEAIAKKEEKERLKAEAKAIAEIKHQRLVKNLRAKMPNKQWLISILKSIKPISIFALAVLFLLIIAAQFINMRILIDPVEKIATENIQDKVNIKSINISLFPSPHLLLKDITIADSKTINAQKISVYPDLIKLKDTLFNASNTPYEIQKVSIEGLNIAQKDISRITSWSGASSRDQQLKIEKIILKKLSINLNVVQLPYFDGELLLDNVGLLHKANFTTETKNLNIEINQLGDDYMINVEALRWRAPLSPYPIFTKLNAKGAINNNMLTFSSINSDLYNGNLTAQLEMNLSSPTLASKGTFNINNFYLGDMAKELKLDTAVDGKLNIKGDYAFDINKPLNKFDITDLHATFDIKNGQLRKVDITEAMRSGNLSGSTDFTHLSGNISLKNQVYIFSNLLLRDNQLQATGQINISPDQHVSGVISSKIALKRNAINARLVIDGPMSALKLKN